MSYFRKGDPLDDFDLLDREMARREARLPVCDNCGQRIRDEFYYDVEGEVFCEECLKDLFQRSTADYIEI